MSTYTRGMNQSIRMDIPALTRCHYRLTSVKPAYAVPRKRPYPINPITLGDFLRKRRIDLSLTQKEVARIIGTSITNIRNWELNWRVVSTRYRPAVDDFVGFCYLGNPPAWTFPLKAAREHYGYSLRKLASLVGVDWCTIAAWERDTHRPTSRKLRKLRDYLLAQGFA